MAFLGSLTPVSSQNWDSRGAQQTLEQARELRAQIAQSPNPSRDQYLRCIQAYRRVYAKDPVSSACDDAVYEAGILYQEMGDRFAAPEYYKEAIRFFRFLVSDYAASRFCPDALLRAGDLYAGPLADKEAAGKQYHWLRSEYPHSGSAKILASRAESRSVSVAGKVVSEPEKAISEQKASTQAAPAVPSGPTPSIQQRMSPTATVGSIRHWTTTDYTRVMIDLDRETPYEKSRIDSPERIYFDISNARISKDLQGKSFGAVDDIVKQIRVAQYRPDTVRVVLDVDFIHQYRVSELHDPFRIVVDISSKPNPGFSASQALPDSSSKPDASRAVASAKEPSPRGSVTGTMPVSETAKIAASDKPSGAKAAELVPIATPAAPVAAGTQPKAVEVKPVASTSQRVETAKQPDMNSPSAPQPKTGANPAPERTVSPVSDTPSATAATPAAQPKPVEVKPAASETRSRPAAPAPVDIPKPAIPTSRGDRTLTRVLGLKIGRIVIDPGHGGHDTGTIGPGGLMEKDVVLEIARNLKSMLEEKLNAQVLLTRQEDVFVPLEQRTALANQHQADLFISIHANSSSIKSASGVETYYLDFARTAAEREVAARENAATSQNVRDLEELIKQIIQADKSKESRELASMIQRKLFADSQHLFPMPHNRGVRRAPFVVLIGANMPSVLAEVAFISNPRDEKLLRKPETRLHLAQSLYVAIEGYMKALGTSVAQH